MKKQMLFLAFSFWIILLFNDLLLRMILILALSYFFYKRDRGNPYLFVVILLICCFVTLPQNQDMPEHKVVIIEKIKKNYAIGKVDHQKVMLYGLEKVAFHDVIKIEGDYEEIHALSNFYGFDFKQWLNQDQIQYQMKVEHYQIQKQSKRLSAHLYRHACSLKDKEHRTFVLAHLYGIKEKGDTYNLSYFISASGLHIALLGTLLCRFCLRFLSKQKASLFSFILMFLLGYCTAFSYSLIRFLIFRGVSLCHIAHKKDKLGYSIILWCLLFPTHLFELSFILPVLFQIVDLFDQQKRSRFVKQMLILIPIQLLYFYECNIIQIMLFPVFRYLFLIFYSYSLLSTFFTWLNLLNPMMISIEHFILQLNLPSFIVIGLPSFLWLYYWLNFSLKTMRYNHSNLIIQFVLLLVWQQYAFMFQPFYEVMFINVGQGDSALITLPFNQGAMMIDVCGNLFKNIPKDVILPILKGKGIEHLDLVVLTHDDFDHSGGLPELKKLIKIKKVITKKQPSIQMANVSFHVILNQLQFEDQNENSIVLYTNILNNKFLFTGDAGLPFERLMMKAYPDLDIDVLKVGHHGSNSASSSMFIQQLSPKIASISSGYHNRYHHPHPDTIKNLKKQNSYISNTAYDGAMRIRIFPFFSILETSNHKLSFYLNP
ncbi:MAG: MBL fold metallo-hydrolase [Erysipelotrichaceae bacterium]